MKNPLASTTSTRQPGTNNNPWQRHPTINSQHSTTDIRQPTQTTITDSHTRQPKPTLYSKQSTTDRKKTQQETVRSKNPFMLLFPRQTDNVNIFFHRQFSTLSFTNGLGHFLPTNRQTMNDNVDRQSDFVRKMHVHVNLKFRRAFIKGAVLILA